jgi:hypothetical protein
VLDGVLVVSVGRVGVAVVMVDRSPVAWTDRRGLGACRSMGSDETRISQEILPGLGTLPTSRR